jgi:23S rRNA (adenine2503-C2)-methyltransferase
LSAFLIYPIEVKTYEAPPMMATRFISADGTVRYLLRLDDGESAECVLIPRKDRNTFCLSSQIGCSLGCAFCLTGQMGLIRDLSAGEIVAQFRLLRQDSLAEKNAARFSVVLMGMGEPLLNYENVLQAIRVLHDDRGFKVPMTKITVSTAGLVPGIHRLAGEPLFPNLCISLSGATNETRDRLMPINRKHSINNVIEAVRRLPHSRQKRVMFEVVMIKDLTDTQDQAIELSRVLRGLSCKVNLIPLNPAEEIAFERSSEEAILEFQQVLITNGITTFIRKNRGTDISGACGQLKRRVDARWMPALGGYA